jgi:hypothetical protein
VSRHVTGTHARHVDIDLDGIGSHALSPDEQLVAEDGLEWRLKRLDLRDPSLRAVAVKIAEGFTHREIAALLNQPPWVVHEKVRLIKTILGPPAVEPG